MFIREKLAPYTYSYTKSRKFAKIAEGKTDCRPISIIFNTNLVLLVLEPFPLKNKYLALRPVKIGEDLLKLWGEQFQCSETFKTCKQPLHKKIVFALNQNLSLCYLVCRKVKSHAIRYNKGVGILQRRKSKKLFS